MVAKFLNISLAFKTKLNYAAFKTKIKFCATVRGIFVYKIAAIYKSLSLRKYSSQENILNSEEKDCNAFSQFLQNNNTAARVSVC